MQISTIDYMHKRVAVRVFTNLYFTDTLSFPQSHTLRPRLLLTLTLAYARLLALVLTILVERGH